MTNADQNTESVSNSGQGNAIVANITRPGIDVVIAKKTDMLLLLKHRHGYLIVVA